MTDDLKSSAIRAHHARATHVAITIDDGIREGLTPRDIAAAVRLVAGSPEAARAAMGVLREIAGELAALVGEADRGAAINREALAGAHLVTAREAHSAAMSAYGRKATRETWDALEAARDRLLDAGVEHGCARIALDEVTP